MPPKPKVSRDDIINAAYELTRKKGIDAVVAREVGKSIKITTSPIFNYFENMDELKQEVYLKALNECKEYLSESLNYAPAFKEFGLRWIRFAKREPNLYTMLFNAPEAEKYTGMTGFVNKDFDVLNAKIKEEILKTFDISSDNAQVLFEEMAIFAQGIANLVATGAGQFTEKMIGEKLSILCVSLVASFQISNENFDLDRIKLMLDAVNKSPKTDR